MSNVVKSSAEAGQTLWTSNGGTSSFEKLVTPKNLSEPVVQVARDSRTSADERVKPYRTPVTTDTLRAPVK